VRIAQSALIVLLLALAAGCGGDETVARVNDREVSEADVERVFEHFEEEFKREGRELPEEGSEARHNLERNVLDLIVFRIQLEEAAAKTGIELDEEEVEERVHRAEEAERGAEGSAEGGEGELEGEQGEEAKAAEAYFENVVRIQLLRELVAAKLGGADALDGWIQKARSQFPASYEEGWEPVGTGGPAPTVTAIP
jgi:hypothetical protein